MGLILGCGEKEKRSNSLIINLLERLSSGETGIRTPGTSQFNGFQDRRNRPLCHLSKVLYSKVSWESLFPFRLRVQR